MKHSSIAIVVLCLGVGCGKSTPQQGTASAQVTMVTDAPAGDPVVVVGDPTHTPGHFGGPCKNEDCGHEACIAARKFIADAHPCPICGKPIVWGDDIIAFFVDGKLSKAAGGGGRLDPDSKWQSRLNEIDVVCHEKCREEHLCAICNLPLAQAPASLSGKPPTGPSERFHLHDDKWSHDSCYQSDQEQSQADPTE
ncbi:MAG TPA: hypothetical protein VG826_16725 [Pirellulales bacterium]|nr:hypothetical protein [Pirellulales bacterium]